MRSKVKEILVWVGLTVMLGTIAGCQSRKSAERDIDLALHALFASVDRSDYSRAERYWDTESQSRSALDALQTDLTAMISGKGGLYRLQITQLRWNPANPNRCTVLFEITFCNEEVLDRMAEAVRKDGRWRFRLLESEMTH